MLQRLFLLSILLFSYKSFSQVKQATVKNPKIYVIEQQSDSLVLKQKEIYLEVAEYVFDSCNFYSNSFEFEFELQNITDKPLACNKTLTCWNDCGLIYAGRINQELLVIAPGKTEKIKVRVNPYQKKSMSTRSDFILLYGDKKEVLIPIQLKFSVTSMLKCEKN